MPTIKLNIKDIVAGRFSGPWHLGVVTKVFPSGAVQVKHADGDVERYPVGDIGRILVKVNVPLSNKTYTDVSIKAITVGKPSTAPKPPKIRTSRENDDKNVPIVRIPVHLEEMYAEVPTNNVRNSPEAGRFIRKLWDYLNREKFHSQLKAPNFLLTKDMGENMRRRGYWQASRRVIGLSPRLFNGHQNFFVEILLHEMAHQAVSEIDHVVETVNKGHGPHWQKWMRKVGLNPLRYDPNPNTVYMKEGERKAHEQKVQKIRENEHQNMKKLQTLNPIYSPVAGMLVKGVWNGEQVDGALAYPYGRGWTVMEHPYQRQMKVIQLDKLFKHPNPEKVNKELPAAAINAFRQNEERLKLRKDRSALRRGFSLPWDR